MNRLASEKSPYLLQHKDNPIEWYAWGEDAFADARRANKLIFLSIGYSTCHWCHVMAHESFEDQEVAKFLNDHFVCIKVDREERPDVDGVYMTALQALTGGGGWPMSVWLEPDGKPFFAGTYFPKYRFLQLLRRIQEIWRDTPENLSADGQRLTEVIRAAMANPVGEANEAEYEDFLKGYISYFQPHFDERHGGFGGAPKFPQTMNLMVMMRQDFKSGLNQAEVLVTETLNRMSRGGIYDHLMGGFHRYSVDEAWLVPHFEKMLYDQALITLTLLEAHQFYKVGEFADVARETLDYVLREMTSSGGRFYSAQDADSRDPDSGHSEEGYFCTFTYAEVSAALNADELAIMERAFGLSRVGHLEGRNILNLQDGFDRTVSRDPLVVSAFAKLRAIRQGRPAPHLDDKAITAWNGWMIGALAKAARVLNEAKFLRAAQAALEPFMNEIYRFWREGASQGAALAEDYAAIINACLEVYQCDFDPRWANRALELQADFDKKFWNDEEGLYFSNDGADPLLPLRPKDDHDGVHPGANSLAALNLVRLHALTGERLYQHRVERLFGALFAKLKAHPSSLPFLALALDAHLADYKVAVFTGGKWAEEFHREQVSRFHPYVFWAKPNAAFGVCAGKPVEPPAVYVCLEGHCLKPAASRSEADQQM